jgi:hypothetical protein
MVNNEDGSAHRAVAAVEKNGVGAAVAQALCSEQP